MAKIEKTALSTTPQVRTELAAAPARATAPSAHPAAPRTAPQAQAVFRQARPQATASATQAAEAALAARESRRAKASAGSITLGGKSVPQLAPTPTPPRPIQQKLIDGVFGTAFETALPGAFGFKDLRSADAAKQAMSAPLVQGKDGKPASLGQLAIFRPGLGNIPPSPAQVFRAAQHAGKVVVAYTNSNDPAQNQLRPLTEVGGVPVPPELRGKIFGIGSPKHAVISYEQSSDTFLKQLETMHNSQKLLGADVLTSGATVIAHSQGSLDSALTRQRLEEAGFPNAIGKLVTLAPAFGGSDLAAKAFGQIGGGALSLLDGDDGKRALQALNPALVKATFTPDKQRLVDLTLTSTIGDACHVQPKFGFPPFEVKGNNNIRPQFRILAGGGEMNRVLGGDWGGLHDLLKAGAGSQDNDGMVTLDSARFGKQFAVLDKHYDHAGIIEDADVIDQILKRL